MLITRTSVFTGKTHTLDLPVSQAQVTGYVQGTLAQDAFPQLSADEREFIISGVTPEEWATLFPPEDN